MLPIKIISHSQNESSIGIKMHLLIDWGNTLLKALLVKDLNLLITRPSELNPVSFESSEAFSDWLRAQAASEALEYILIASVREDQQTQQLIQQIEPFCQNLFISETSAVSAGVRCAYADPSKLGIDRWLGLLAGYNKQHTSAIIDIGSAITVDVVNSKGNHLGGHIIPGEKLIKGSLKLTGKVFAEVREDNQSDFKLGSTTGECVDFGIQQLIEGYLRRVVLELVNQYQVENWIFAGGGGLFWKKRLQSSEEVITNENSNFCSNIVFSGLVIDFLEKAERAQFKRL